MPRLNLNRTISTEDDVAARVRMERENRGWSPAQLAQRMTDEGCSIATSAIYKLEADGRRITVNELVALAKVFELEVDDLLRPIESVRLSRAKEVLEKLDQHEVHFGQGVSIAAEAYIEAFRLRVEDPELWEYVMNRRYGRRAGDEPEGESDGTPVLSFFSDGEELPVSDLPIREAIYGLEKAIIDVAAEVVEWEAGGSNGEHPEA